MMQSAEDVVVPIVAIVSIFVVAPIAIAFARLVWKRASDPARPRVEPDLLNRRLEQLQQSVEAMAIEVERISEGQRFVTKLLSGREREALGAGSEKRN
jgi:hypothetical protein